MGEPVWVRRVVSVSITEATPRSSTVTVPSGLTITLRGLRSRWTIGTACTADSTAHSCAATATAHGHGYGVVLGEVVGEVGALDVLHDEVELLAVAARVVHGDQAGVVDLRGDPALAHEAAPQLVGASWPATLSGRSSFTATRRSSRWSYAVQTWPMPPCPRTAASS